MSDPVLDEPPCVSVVIPVHNGEEFLREAIDSVLAQSYRSFELIVVDDGSTDQTCEIARSYPAVRYISQEQRGPAAARNRGVQAARGEYLAFLDADDLWMPDKLAHQLKAFEADPTLDIVSGEVEQFTTPRGESSAGKRYLFAERPLAGYSTIALLIRRTAFEKIGPFDEGDRASEVIRWLVHMVEVHPNMMFLPELVARRRIHGNNMSIAGQQDKFRNMMRILKGSIDRKRSPEST